MTSQYQLIQLRPLRIAVLANVKGHGNPKFNSETPADVMADFDHIETIDAIRAAIETDGHSTIFLPADQDLPYTLRDAKPDLCFNIAEGMGVDSKAIVKNLAELNERVQYLLHFYKQPALVEKYLTGREFTVGLIGRWDSMKYSRHPEWYEKNKLGYHHFPVLELVSDSSVTPGLYSQAAKSIAVGEEGAPDYVCPAPLDETTVAKINNLVTRAHMSIKSIDYSRTDIRLDDHDEPCLIEINTLPGLTPGFSDLCLEAAAEGISYQDLILDILYLGASRWGLLPGRDVTLPKDRLRKKNGRPAGTNAFD